MPWHHTIGQNFVSGHSNQKTLELLVLTLWPRVVTVIEKSWNIWNLKICGKVMEFRLKLTKVMEKSWNFEMRTKSPVTNRFNILLMQQLIQARAACISVMEFCHMVMEKSWNFVMEILWQFWWPWPLTYILDHRIPLKYDSCCEKITLFGVESRTGRSPTFWTRTCRLTCLGLAGTLGPVSPIEEIFSFKTAEISWATR